VHRDLKPENLMLVDPGGVKILDFGVARFLNAGLPSGTSAESLTETGHIVGTLPYMAPEVICGIKSDPRSDLYSLGVVAFEMATGRRPFPNDEPHELMYIILNQAPPAPRIMNGRISPGLEAVILRLLDKRPEERFGSAAELREALRSIAPPPPRGGAATTGTPHPEGSGV
jgi:serine/threonine-protein kinase